MWCDKEEWWDEDRREILGIFLDFQRRMKWEKGGLRVERLRVLVAFVWVFKNCFIVFKYLKTQNVFVFVFLDVLRKLD